MAAESMMNHHCVCTLGGAGLAQGLGNGRLSIGQKLTNNHTNSHWSRH